MTKKFTEEQYQKITNAWDKQFLYKRATQSVIDELREGYLGMGDQALALANPLTREWAHDNFVEKEKKYVWTSKKANSNGKNKRLFWQMSAKAVQDYFTNDENAFDNSEFLTESEIEAWGYNSEMFNREEEVQ